jgi:DNA modification methylase
LISELILKHSNPGDLVLDTFSGTGTTGHACILNDRKYILIEREEKYFDLMKKRLEKISTNSNLLDIKK